MEHRNPPASHDQCHIKNQQGNHSVFYNILNHFICSFYSSHSEYCYVNKYFSREKVLACLAE